MLHNDIINDEENQDDHDAHTSSINKNKDMGVIKNDLLM